MTATLSKKNFKNNSLEIDSILKMFGEDDRTSLISSLLDEIDFSNGRPIGKDDQKVNILENVLFLERWINFTQISPF